MWITDQQAAPRELVGGKGRQLLLLRSWGLNVPPFGVVTTEAYRGWKRTGQLPGGLVERIHESMRSWGAVRVAVRSSMTAEDGAKSSYAGVMETFLEVEPGSVAERIVDCFRSLDSDRARAYHEARSGSDQEPLEAAVVVQAMVAAESAGVAFSRAPTGNSAFVYVEGAPGLGEAVVSGRTEVDGFWWDRFGAEIRRAGPASRDACLSHDALRELTDCVVELEARLESPCDVEWAWAGGRFHYLQIRPITQKFPKLSVYVDTNLAESYPGLTSPLTSDFVRLMYSRVFEEASRWIGFSEARIDALGPAYRDLVRNFEGHLYYHLNRYYAVLASLPGGPRNLDSWHRMIGGKLHGAVEYEPAPPLGFFGIWRVRLALARLALFSRRYFGGFVSSARARAGALDAELAQCRARGTARDTLALFSRSLADTGGWGLPAVNDLFVMGGLRRIESILKKSGQPVEGASRLLRTSEGVESLRPLRDLQAICTRWAAHGPWVPALERAIAKPSEAWVILRDAGLGEATVELQAFLDRFGDRAFEELKLECPTFRQDVAGFLSLCRWLTTSSVAHDPAVPSGQGPLPRMTPGLILAVWFTRRAIRIRESTRLLRGHYYGWVRRAILQASEQLASERPGIFGRFSASDYFGLKLDDLMGYGGGTLSADELGQRVSAGAGWSRPGMSYPEMFCHPRGEETSTAPTF
ncbi:MAG TPA: PEP/pyruvate-binding domain-containing protein, partial [Bdellovibrionota bacterium]|nr:PEP/pyruvate-binding domain-containing protein [Bdellovibrionota bacterium]